MSCPGVGGSAGVPMPIGLLLLVGAVAKSAQLPLHIWLPYAMRGPDAGQRADPRGHHGDGGRVLGGPGSSDLRGGTCGDLPVSVVGIGALFGAVVAAGQSDIKRVLAFSTLCQVGYMFLGTGLGAYAAAPFHFHPRLLQGAALSGRRHHHPPLRRRPGHPAHGRPGPLPAVYVLDVSRRDAGARGLAAAVGLLQQGRDRLFRR